MRAGSLVRDQPISLGEYPEESFQEVLIYFLEVISRGEKR
jgi:hypothetical protein